MGKIILILFKNIYNFIYKFIFILYLNIINYTFLYFVFLYFQSLATCNLKLHGQEVKSSRVCFGG